MKTTRTDSNATADTGDILTDSLADAGYWKRQARNAQADKAELLAALELAISEIDWHKANAGLVLRGMGDHNIAQARAAIAKAKGVQS